MAGIFTTVTTTTARVAPHVVAMPVHLRIDGTEARSTDLRIKRDGATNLRVREIWAQAYEANEALRRSRL